MDMWRLQAKKESGVFRKKLPIPLMSEQETCPRERSLLLFYELRQNAISGFFPQTVSTRFGKVPVKRRGNVTFTAYSPVRVLIGLLGPLR
jgi:hypothetical protein